MNSEAQIEYIDEDSGLLFTWAGGAYIDVGPSEYPPDEGFSAFDVINVWDDENDRSYFENEAEAVNPRRVFRFVLEAFEDCCRAYLQRMGDDDAEAN